MGVVALCTREDVLNALDVPLTPRQVAQIDRLVLSNADSICSQLRRIEIAPTLATRTFRWPDRQMGSSYTLWLAGSQLASPDITLTSNGVLFDPSTYFVEPDFGPPYTRIELNQSGSDYFGGGATPQRQVAIRGLFGVGDDSTPVGTTVGTITSSNDLITNVMPEVGVGSVLQIEAERLICTKRDFVDTAQTITGNVDDSTAGNGSLIPVTLTGSTTVRLGETILIDAEQMLVTGTAGSNVTVVRAWAGTALAAHTSGATVYAQRKFTVERGALGTTAAQHLAGTSWTLWTVPPLIRQLAIAEVLNAVEQEGSGYARQISSGDAVRNAMGTGIADIRQRCFDAYGIKAIQRAG